MNIARFVCNLFSRCLTVVLIFSLTSSATFAAENKQVPKKMTPAASPAPQIKMEDLGFAKEFTKSDPELQLRLESRSSKLKNHQVTGFITLGLMAASLAFVQSTDTSNAHQYLGMATAASYWTTFYLSQSAPSPEVEPKGWNIKIHKVLRWVTVPLMILTPIAGIQASNQRRHGEELHGLAPRKKQLGGLTAGFYALSAAVMFFEF